MLGSGQRNIMRRSKVVLIKGFADISPKITLGAYERINADHVVLMAALRFPQSIPDCFCKFQMDVKEINENVETILKFWEQEDNCHIVSAEYANIVIDRVGKDVRSVEGRALTVPWFYETIRNYHRHFGQVVIDCEVFNEYVEIDEERLSMEEAIRRLQPHPSLG